MTVHIICSFPACSPLFSCLLPFHRLLFRPLALNTSKYTFHPHVIRLILLLLFLLLHAGKEASILPQLPDGSLPLLFVLFTKLGGLVALVVWIAGTQV